MRKLLAIGAVAFCVGASSVTAQQKYVDPWDPAVEAAAEKAVARLGPTPALEIRATVLTIPALVPP
jgi:hypothetical protein